MRLPLALLSCAAMPAAYGLGEALSGRRAARWMLTIAALCPIFVLCLGADDLRLVRGAVPAADALCLMRAA